MRARRPHYFLRTQAAAPPAPPCWAFSLQAADHSTPITAGDQEPNATWERLQLLAVVRGLEALPEPALVTLSTASDVVQRGIKYGLQEWREFDWQLEHFGELIPVKNADLWRRIDRALVIHDVQIRNMRVDEPIVAEQTEQPHFARSAGKSRLAQAALSESGLLTRGNGSPHIPSFGVQANSPSLPIPTGIRESTSLWDSDNFDDTPFTEPQSLLRVAQQSGTVRGNRQTTNRDANTQNSQKPVLPAQKNHPSRQISLLRIRRRLRASRLHLMRRIGELWSSWVWFYEVSGLQQLTRSPKKTPPPWLRDHQSPEHPQRH